MNDRTKTRKPFGRVSLTVLAVMLGGGGTVAGVLGWMYAKQPLKAYSSAGYGGIVGTDNRPADNSTVQLMSEAYANGNHDEAGRLAEDLIRRAKGAPRDAKAQHDGLLSLRVLAYDAARQKNFTLAKSRFESLRQAAYETPDHGKQRVPLGDVAPTLEEEGAFQKAVCTTAMGDKPAAEGEFNRFLTEYPQSILVHAATKRVARFHEGNVPKPTEALWKLAMQTQKATQDEQKRQQAMCGPEALAELLRRHGGKQATVAELAIEMKTNGDGTSLAEMQKAAKAHGLPTKAVALTQKGLAAQKTPLLTLLNPGHFVLVEAVSPKEVTVWDPDAKGIGQGDRRVFELKDWKGQWSGESLAGE